MAPVFFGVDVETAGPSLERHGLVAIGVAAVQGRQLLMRHRWVIQETCWELLNTPPGEPGTKSFDQATLRRFWHRNPGLLERLLHEGPVVPLHVACFGLSQTLGWFQEKYGARNVVVVTDTVSFDLPVLYAAMDRCGVNTIGTV